MPEGIILLNDNGGIEAMNQAILALASSDANAVDVAPMTAMFEVPSSACWSDSAVLGINMPPPATTPAVVAVPHPATQQPQQVPQRSSTKFGGCVTAPAIPS